MHLSAPNLSVSGFTEFGTGGWAKVFCDDGWGMILYHVRIFTIMTSYVSLSEGMVLVLAYDTGFTYMIDEWWLLECVCHLMGDILWGLVVLERGERDKCVGSWFCGMIYIDVALVYIGDVEMAGWVRKFEFLVCNAMYLYVFEVCRRAGGSSWQGPMCGSR